MKYPFSNLCVVEFPLVLLLPKPYHCMYFNILELTVVLPKQSVSWQDESHQSCMSFLEIFDDPSLPSRILCIHQEKRQMLGHESQCGSYCYEMLVFGKMTVKVHSCHQDFVQVFPMKFGIGSGLLSRNLKIFQMLFMDALIG